MSTPKKSVVLKILTVGDGGVGKTTLLHRYKKNEFLSDTKMTLGVGFFVKKIRIAEKNIMLQLWDFGGQDQFRFMLQKYAMGARGAILMYDLTRFGTLQNLEEWIGICRKDNPKLPIILIGSKLDLMSDDIEQNFLDDIINKFNLFDHLKVSSKTGENVLKIFTSLTEKIIELEGNTKVKE